SAYGGKLTTYRVLAEDVLNMVNPFLPNSGNPWTADKPLPGGDIPQGDFNSWYVDFTSDFEFLDESLLKHLGTTYGAEALDILDGVSDKSDLGRCFGSNFYEREALWIAEHEMTKFADDILFRRTKHGLFLSSEERDNFENWMISTNL
ncbi:MAG: glycerol-3-phosphate dehydrogenase, partial [Rhodobacteraceae bacterium]|nr:glycerol-3-phosphate dehydrogenase [Paracoccaceae bacterium]